MVLSVVVGTFLGCMNNIAVLGVGMPEVISLGVVILVRRLLSSIRFVD